MGGDVAAPAADCATNRQFRLVASQQPRPSARRTPRTDEIISAGASGVACWSSSPDAAASAKAGVLPAAERPILTPAGVPVPWAHGQFERARRRLVYGCVGSVRAMAVWRRQVGKLHKAAFIIGFINGHRS